MQIAPVVRLCFLVLMIAGLQLPLYAQKDTSQHRNSIEGFLKNRKGMIGKLAHNLVNDTAPPSIASVPLRNDLTFNPYEDRVIRDIEIQTLDFGTPIADTGRNFRSNFTRLANNFHRKSRDYVIRNNLFFRKGDRVQSYLLADNERHLRDQPYIQDAKIVLVPVRGTKDTVDVIVKTKDVLSVGGSLEIHNPQSAEASVKEDNLGGGGNSLSIGALYNQARFKHAGYSAQYVNRNILGSFIDGYAGYTSYGNSLNTGQKEEELSYVQLIKPLINPYTRFTYDLEAYNHVLHNMFWPDSLYKSDIKYHYYNYDAWIGWNTGAYNLRSNTITDGRLRTLLSLRYFRQVFLDLPNKYANQYYFQYADITGALGAISIFKQNFYKAQYFYGFGRNEDVPEGVDLSLTGGYINKQGLYRPYAGIDLQRYYFTSNKAYYNFTFRTGAYYGDGRIEDMNMLLSVDHWSRVLYLGTNWKQRTVINASITGQVNQVLNAPLNLESDYGLEEWKNSLSAGGDIRTTLRAESVFFSPFTFINFHFAPFVFADLCAMTPVKQNLNKTDLYSAIGGGIRTRNESLIFGTFELKVFYFPRNTFVGDTWRIETNTGIKFKYNSQYIKRPVLINVN